MATSKIITLVRKHAKFWLCIHHVWQNVSGGNPYSFSLNHESFPMKYVAFSISNINQQACDSESFLDKLFSTLNMKVLPLKVLPYMVY